MKNFCNSHWWPVWHKGRKKIFAFEFRDMIENNSFKDKQVASSLKMNLRKKLKSKCKAEFFDPQNICE